MKKRWASDQVYFAADGEGGGAGGAVAEAIGTPPVETWYGKAGIAPEHHEFIKGKEFADLNTVIASHRNLESMIGRNRLAIPQNAEDKEAYENIYKTLGRPDKPEYKLVEGIKFNEDTWKAFSPIAHQAGLSQAQVDAVTKWYFETGTAAQAATETERTNAEQREVAALEKEWGSNTAANKDLASRAFRSLGLDEETTGKIEAAIGYKRTMEIMHKIGSGLKEDAFHQDTTQRGGGTETAASVQGKIDTLLKDAEFKKRYTDHDPRVRKSAIEEMEALQMKLAKLQQPAGQQ